MESKPPVSDGQKNDHPAPSAEAVSVLLATIGDTTWRMFVPSIGFTLLGVWADASFGTKPWLMAAGIAIGLLGAVLLVKNQLGGLKKKKEPRA